MPENMKADDSSKPAILIAVQDYKGTIPAKAVASAIERGILDAVPNATVVIDTVSDGGQGTLDSLVDTQGGHYRTSSVTGALGDPTEVVWALTENGSTAIIESANIVGHQLVVESRRDPTKADTTGVGDLILEALDLGFRQFLIGIGGSSTNDGGTGAARRLGARFLEADGTEITDVLGLINLDSIDTSGIDPRIDESNFICLCDGIPPLVGHRGASRLYGPQKGASSAQVEQLEQALTQYGRISENQLNVDVLEFDMAGCAGGLAAGLKIFTNAELKIGIDYILEIKELDKKISNADLVIVGEGQTDIQTVYYKSPVGVSKLAGSLNRPVIAISATLGDNWEEVLKHNIAGVWPVSPSSKHNLIVSTESMIQKSTTELFNRLSNATDNWNDLTGNSIRTAINN